MSSTQAIQDFANSLGIDPKFLNAWRDTHLHMTQKYLSRGGTLLVLVDTRYNQFALYHDDYSTQGAKESFVLLHRNYEPRNS